MYEAYFGLTKKPFSLISDAEFLYMGNTHSAAFAMLEYGVLNQAGFTVITGEVGSGKTTLIQHLLKLRQIRRIFTETLQSRLRLLDCRLQFALNSLS